MHAWQGQPGRSVVAATHAGPAPSSITHHVEWIGYEHPHAPSHTSSVHESPSEHGWESATHCPAWQRSLHVQGFRSSHEPPSFTFCFAQWYAFAPSLTQAPFVHAVSRCAQLAAAPALHAPPLHWSPCVQPFESRLHAVPSPS
jgi:hypothetical protein